MSQKIENVFKKPYDKRTHEGVIPNGTQTEDVYSYAVNALGRKELVKTGERNIWEEIQAELEETKIENVLARALAGDGSVFRPDGIYADISTMPSNLIEARQEIQKLENLWATVPNEIKNKYNNSIEDFISASGTNEWLHDMKLDGIELPKDTTPTPEKAGTYGEAQGAVKEGATEA